MTKGKRTRCLSLWNGVAFYRVWFIFFYGEILSIKFFDTMRNIPLYKTVVFFCVITRSLHSFFWVKISTQNFADQSCGRIFCDSFLRNCELKALTIAIKSQFKVDRSTKVARKSINILWNLLAFVEFKTFFFVLRPWPSIW